MAKRKVGNRPKLFACKCHATYCWKDLDEDYNFALDFISIRGFQKKLWASKIVEVPISGILGFSVWEFQDKMTFG
jgi:hypothetical protein